MKKVIFSALPFDKKLVTLALESGVDAIVTSPDKVEAIKSLGRTEVMTMDDLAFVELQAKPDEEEAVRLLKEGKRVVLKRGWEIIPVENILAQHDGLALEVASLDEARLAAGILERGVDTLVVLPAGAADLKNIVADVKLSQGRLELGPAVITAIKPVGLGHRVCVDTMSMMRSGQGMLVGNSSSFTFLVNAETESNPYVAARPFRVNAGAVHAYAVMPGDKTSYLEELSSGSEVLVVSADGSTTLATVGRVKIEIRPMLLITAKAGETEGNIFLQNAETIRLVRKTGEPVSVVSLREGDEVLVKLDEAGRHFGMRISEAIEER